MAENGLTVGDRCQFCNADARLECHDKWEYDDKECVATLVGFEIRCKAALDIHQTIGELASVGSSRVDLQACKLEYSIVSPK